ncbi:MAG TPA: hypothetical protein VF656_01930 [Pyrinomonadaceae bacterium]|jgi:hypothetical protein
MFRKFISVVLVIVILGTGCGALARSKQKTQQQEEAAAEAKRAEKVEKLRRKVLARGTGTKARVAVKLHDGTKLKGYITATTADGFTVVSTDKQPGAPVHVSYSDVDEFKAHGKGMSTTSKILIGTGATLLVSAAVLAFMFRNFRLKLR